MAPLIKLVVGDSILFLRADNGDLRRRKRGINGDVLDFALYGSGFSKESNEFLRNPKGKFSVEFVINDANLAANGKWFAVFYYPQASTPEFCVKASTVNAAMQVQWCHGMRFKMAFVTEDL